MGNTSSASNDPYRRVQWMWNSNANSSSKSKSKSAEWCLYSDIESMILEEAYIAGKTHAMLDDYHVDLKNKFQISNNDVNKQQPVKRMVCGKDDKRLREERFMSNPVSPNCLFGDQYGFIPYFIKEIAKDLKLTKQELPSKNEKIVPMIVEKAALGIIEEGKKIGKQREAEYIANLLTSKKEAGIKEVWNCCAHLYSLESFLYKKLNETMRLIESDEHEEVWRSKINTLGPFCLLLWDNPFDNKKIKPGTILYRGAKLPDDLITSFKDTRARNSLQRYSFQAFTSCSRNRSMAEKFGNVLFIMHAKFAFTIDLIPLSKYPGEEEELLFPGVSFTVDEINYDTNKNKHLIYLTLQQKHKPPTQSQSNAVLMQSPPGNQTSLANHYFKFGSDDDYAGYDGRDGLLYDWK